MSGGVKLQEIVICTQTYPRFRGDVNAPFLHNLAKSFAKKRSVTVVAPHHKMAKEEEIVELLNPEAYIGESEEIVDNVLLKSE